VYRSAIKQWVESNALPVGIGGIVLALVGGGVGIAGLASGGDEPETVETTVAVTLPIAVTETTEATEDDTTGTTAAAETGSQGWTAVKVDNGPSAHPQIGLGDATLVVEVPVEAGITRFTAFYPSGGAPPLVGPVRSMRPVDADLVTPFAHTVVSTGGQDSVRRAVTGAGLAQVDLETAIGFQILERPSPSNYFVDLLQVENAFPPPADEVPGLPSGAWPGGGEAASVMVPFGVGVNWDYDGSAYLRSEGGEPFEVLDEYEGELSQLSTDTVVILFTAQRWAGYYDTNGAEVPDFDVIGSGRLAVFSQGEVVEGTWLRRAQDEGFAFFDSTGASFGLPEGRVAMAIVDRELEVAY
jgi:hypothetical protein